jgi:hypothetical protein
LLFYLATKIQIFGFGIQIFLFPAKFGTGFESES